MPTSTLGSDLKALRKIRKVTLVDLAERMGKSIGWLSQVERGISIPNDEDLAVFAAEFEVPLTLFQSQIPSPVSPIVRANGRRNIGEREAGMTETLLSPDLTDSFEVIHSVFAPSSIRQTAANRSTQELAYMISGKLDIWLDDEKFTVHEGDSFRIRGNAFRWENPYQIQASAVWVISPPVY